MKRREEVGKKKGLIILEQESKTCFHSEEKVWSYGQCWRRVQMWSRGRAQSRTEVSL